MPFVRFVHADPRHQIRLHLARLGLPEDAVDYAADRIPGLQALVTGAGMDGVKALRRLRDGVQSPGTEAYPWAVLGDSDRAMGTAYLAGRRDQFERLGRDLLDQGAEAALLGREITASLARLDGVPAPSRIGGVEFAWGSRTFVMGILNVTPDSFADGGRYASLDEAVAHGEQLAADGADILDIGGESTRPGAEEVDEEEEIRRVVPVIERLATRLKIPISIDTTKSQVAVAAVNAGATLVNDISGFKHDLEMAHTVARLGVAACVMHMQGTPRTMQISPSYFDVVGEIMEALAASVDHGVRSGIAGENILVDPGICFGKTVGHNTFLLRNLRQLRGLGQPVLVGASRKSLIGKIAGSEVDERLPGTIAAHTAAILNGADMIRVHDVKEAVQAAKVADAIVRADEGGFAFLV